MSDQLWKKMHFCRDFGQSQLWTRANIDPQLELQLRIFSGDKGYNWEGYVQFIVG
ncbi:hypothetical protein FHR92_003698 [Fontibacillus solani]|uniref:Uncharacterized protein n=1 Tax=Fontibacillus solani TaxID=1572857 RepID=A0A7W3XT37_9BACL|nr:hypothetical protein [Fontibacillus solani]